MRSAVIVVLGWALLGLPAVVWSAGTAGAGSSSAAASAGESAPALERVVARYPFRWQGTPESPRDPGHGYPSSVVEMYRSLGEFYLLQGKDLARGHLLIGQSLTFRRKFAEARTAFEAGLAVAPTADLAYGVGWCVLRESNDWSFPQRSIEAMEKAVAAFEHALRLEADHSLALNSLAYCHYWLAIKTRPGGVSGERGDAVAWARHVDAGITAWKRYLERFPASSGIYYRLGELCHGWGDLQETARCWEQAVRMGGPFPSPLSLVHLYENEIKDMQAAENLLQEFAKGQRLRTGAAVGWDAEIELARFWLRHERHDEAIALLWARSRYERTAYTLFELGKAYHAAGRPDEALHWYRDAQQLLPGFAEALDKAIARASPEAAKPRSE